MNHKLRSILAGLLVLALVSLACGISIPSGTTIDNAATAVAGTVNALAGTAESLITVIPHDLTVTPDDALPTLPPLVEAAPLRVSFAAPDGSLYTWTEGMATAVQLVGPSGICCSFVSPDGTLIAFTRYTDYQFVALEVINSDGSNRRTLLDAAAMNALPRPDGSVGSEAGQIVWVPNSHVLAMNTRTVYEGPGLAFSENLYLINTDTNMLTTLLSTGSSSWKFFYSPDASKIAVSLPTQVDMYNADGSVLKLHEIYYDFVNTASEYAWVASPVWSADSLNLAAGVPPANPWDEVPDDSRVYRFAADGLSGEISFQTQMPFLEGGSVAFAPDHSKFLYFTRFGVPADNTYTLNIGFFDGTPNVAYTNGGFPENPVWSADNTHFFYAIGSGGTNTPYIGQVGAAPAVIADYTNAGQIQWLDANRYLVVSQNAGVYRLLLGTIGAPTGLIFDSGSASSNFLTFSVNR
ncbi:MAG: TolB-like translocation protein [Anaerolineaceae bacterium]